MKRFDTDIGIAPLHALLFHRFHGALIGTRPDWDAVLTPTTGPLQSIVSSTTFRKDRTIHA